MEAALVESKETAGARSKRILKSEAPPDEEAVLRAAGAEPKQPSPEPGGSAAAQQTAISTSRGFLDWLVTNRMSVALTSYQTGQLLLIGPKANGRLSVFQRNFVRAMGLWPIPSGSISQPLPISGAWRTCLGLASRQAMRVNTMIVYMCRVPRIPQAISTSMRSLVDGNGRLLFVNTKYSCLATPDNVHSFKPFWKPSFISKLAPEDRCHLNGLCLKEGQGQIRHRREPQ